MSGTMARVRVAASGTRPAAVGKLCYNTFRPVGWVSCGVIDTGNDPIVTE